MVPQAPEEFYEQEMMDIPTSNPIGKLQVGIEIPVPTIEQVAGEIARQIINNSQYSFKSGLEKLVRESIENKVSALVDEKAASLVEECFTKPVQPTDNYGNPVGAPTTLHAMLCDKVAGWCDGLVDREGKIAERNHYNANNVQSRMSWALTNILNSSMQSEINKEVNKIKETLKEAAEKGIAKQISEKIAGMVFK